MKLKSFGCSFVYGTELPDAVRDGSRITASQLTWPAHLARRLGRDHECHARAGSGNLQIMEQVLTQAVCSGIQDLFVIGWTWIDRFDYYDNQDTQRRHPWHTIMPVDRHAVAKTYHRHLHSEYRDKLTNLVYINTAVAELKRRNIPFVMTYMDDLLFDQTWHVNPAILELQARLKPCMTQFDGQNFLDWSRANKYTVSEKWHPLEQAHESAGDYIFQHLFSLKEKL